MTLTSMMATCRPRAEESLTVTVFQPALLESGGLPGFFAFAHDSSRTNRRYSRTRLTADFLDVLRGFRRAFPEHLEDQIASRSTE